MKAIGGTLLLLGLCIGSAPSLSAAVSFVSGNGIVGTGINGCATSTICFGNITATAWATTGAGDTFVQASLGQYSAGLGVCNSEENVGGCTGNPPEHSVGNQLGANGTYDFVLLRLPEKATAISLVLNTFGNAYDTDATYFVGACSPTAASCTPNGRTLGNLTGVAGFGGLVKTVTSDTGVAGTRTLTLDLSGVTSGGVNWILVGTSTQDTTPDDYFKLESISYTSTVPEPATFGMAGATLLGLGLLRARKKRSSTV